MGMDEMTEQNGHWAMTTGRWVLQHTGLIAVAMILASAVHAQDTLPIETGVWFDDSGQGAIEITTCEQHLCGRIVWLKDPASKNGGPKRDIYNPNPKNRKNTICGLQIIGKLTKQTDGSWDGGWIYDPKIGQAFDVTIRMTSKNVLKVRGYQDLKLFGKDFYWKRATTELPSCEMGP